MIQSFSPVSLPPHISTLLTFFLPFLTLFTSCLPFCLHYVTFLASSSSSSSFCLLPLIRDCTNTSYFLRLHSSRILYIIFS